MQHFHKEGSIAPVLEVCMTPSAADTPSSGLSSYCTYVGLRHWNKIPIHIHTMVERGKGVDLRNAMLVGRTHWL